MLTKTTGRPDMSFLPVGIHEPAKPDQEHLCGFNCFPCSPHMQVHTHTCMCACMCIETHKQELLFWMTYQKSCKLFTAVQLGSPPIFQFQLCFRQPTCQNSAGSCIRLAPHRQLSFRNNDPSLVSKWTSNCSLHSSFGSFTNQGLREPDPLLQFCYQKAAVYF